MSPSQPSPADLLLEGLNILVVEDETIVSFLLEDMLEQLGCAEVWQAGRIEEALAMLDQRRPDAVVLDVNLGGQRSYPVATRLDVMGVPFVFATGYGRPGIPDQWAGQPVLQKPFRLEGLAAALGAVLGKSA